MIISEDGGKTMVLQWKDEAGLYRPVDDADNFLFGHFAEGVYCIGASELAMITEIANLHGIKIELQQVEITRERIDLAHAEADGMLHQLNDR